MTTEVVVTQPENLHVVASSYEELQSLPQLMDAVRRPPVPSPGTELQARRALMQASELIMCNVTHLMRRSWSSIVAGYDLKSVRLLEWLAATMRSWAIIVERLPEFAIDAQEKDRARLSLHQSPHWDDFALAEEHLAQVLPDWIFADPHKPAEEYEAAEPIQAAAKRALMRTTMYERLVLENLSVGWPDDEAYATVVRPAEIKASMEALIIPDSVFMEFRTTHQVPEILTDTINQHIERAIELVGSGSALAAVAALRRVECLLDCSIRLLELLTENLRFDEYHAIRESLGLTSGSHSVGLAYKLMRELYPALTDRLAGHRPPGIRPDEWHALRVGARSVGLRLDRWRLEHLRLPRSNLGESSVGTRSLIGSRDALQTVSRLREYAARRDPLLQKVPQPATTSWGTGDSPLSKVEGLLLAEIADATQTRFSDVQDRRGRFERNPDFKPPRSQPSMAVDHLEKEANDREPQ